MTTTAATAFSIVWTAILAMCKDRRFANNAYEYEQPLSLPGKKQINNKACCSGGELRGSRGVPVSHGASKHWGQVEEVWSYTTYLSAETQEPVQGICMFLAYCQVYLGGTVHPT